MLVIACLVGHLYSQNVNDAQFSLSPALNCEVCASRMLYAAQDDTPKTWHSFFSAEFAGTLAGVDSRLTTEMLRASTRRSTLLADNQQDSPKGTSEATKRTQPSPSATSGSPGHILWVVPAFKVDYARNFKPLTPKEKFQEWARGSYDPLGLVAGAAEAATLEHSSTDGFCGYGSGWAGYGKCFGSLELDSDVSSFIGDFALTTLLHQDPRYFRLGQGSSGKRLWYAVSRVFVTYNDSGHTVFYSSALAGTTAAAGISNLYYPKQDRTLGHTFSRVGIDLANTALYNAAAEFWPDINRKLHQIF